MQLLHRWSLLEGLSGSFNNRLFIYYYAFIHIYSDNCWVVNLIREVDKTLSFRIPKRQHWQGCSLNHLVRRHNSTDQILTCMWTAITSQYLCISTLVSYFEFTQRCVNSNLLHQDLTCKIVSSAKWFRGQPVAFLIALSLAFSLPRVLDLITTQQLSL